MIIILLAALAVCGQVAPATLTVSGVVVDPNGAVVPGALTTLQSRGAGQSQTSTTDKDGAFRFARVPPGSPAAMSYKLKRNPSSLSPLM